MKSKAEWQNELPPETFEVLHCEATERAFTSPLLKENREGHYVCAGCGAVLFRSGTKFDSGTGW
ncbi:MAG TPA: peptide-methionine (R)-S-oxide reductase, partial [Rhodospirillaceae bacterium]|nr:peptide-methionine (R)-S-oxide reductase [Rhodospirillaceae bacterium]